MTNYVYIFGCYTLCLFPQFSQPLSSSPYSWISFKVGHPLPPETLLSHLFTYGCVGSYLQCTSSSFRRADSLIVAHGLQSPGTQKLQCTSLFALQPVGSF